MGTRIVEITADKWAEVFPSGSGGLITNEGNIRVVFFVSKDEPDKKNERGHTVNPGCLFTHSASDESLYCKAGANRGNNYIAVTDI